MPYGYDKPAAAVARLGVFKSYAEVPAQYRLDRYADTFHGRDVWREYADATDAFDTDSERQTADRRRAVESWNAHMTERGTHPALATPDDVNAWCADLLGRMGARRAYNPYFVTVEKLYDWLAYHADLGSYPHRFNSVVMAAAEYADGASGEVWAAKTATRSDGGTGRADTEADSS